jgi:hypothetical protein
VCFPWKKYSNWLKTKDDHDLNNITRSSNSSQELKFLPSELTAN